MKLSVRELKNFRQKAAVIKSNTVLPILSYLKFENNRVTKNAMHSFVIQDLKCSESCLIDEKILMQFIDRCDSDEITVKVEDKRVILSDKHTKIVSPTDDVALFPDNDNIKDLIYQDITDDQLTAIKMASTFTLKRVVGSFGQPFEYIHVGTNSITGTDGHVLFVYKSKEPIPPMILDKESVQAILKMSSVLFAENEKYQFFKFENATYGFSKSEIGFFDMTRFSEVPPDCPKIIVDKTPLINFNELCMASCPLPNPMIKMSPSKRNLDLKMNDSAFEIDLSTLVLAQAEHFDTFSYIPEKMNIILKALPDETLTIYRSDKKIYILSDSDFTTILQESYSTPQN
jgi:hypothetical protein